MHIYIRGVICKIFILQITLLSTASTQTKRTRYDAKPTLALFTFEGKGMKDEEVALYTGYLNLELHQTKSFVLVEKIQIDELMREKDYDKIDCKTADCAIEIGRLAGIKKAIVGSFDLVADTCTIKGSLIGIESKEVEKTAERRYVGDLEGINPYIQIMAWEFAGLDAPKDIKSIVEQATDEEEKKSRWRWVKWAIKPFNYIANRMREFLPSSSTE